MKKTLTINLNNAVFHIDEDAYELLQSYLVEVGNHFKSESEKTDIMNDIEARIAELFNEKMDYQKNVITIDDVHDVIEIMGKPSQFVDDEAADEPKANAQTGDDEQQTKSRKSKKFYRDMDNRLLGGVASGLAAYLNWDVALIRIIFVVLAFVTSGTFVLIYLLMWVIAPKAVTTAQKLEMQGEDVNIETIKNKMVDAKEYLESDKFKASATEAGTRIWEVLRSVLKVVLTLVGGLASLVGVILIAGLIFGLIVFLLEPEAITGLFPTFFAQFGTNSPDQIILLVISLLLIIGAPIFALIYWSLHVISKDKKQRSASGLWVALILWLAGIFMFLGTGASALKKLKDANIITSIWDDEIDREKLNLMSENRQVANFHSIDVSNAIELELSQQSTQSVSLSSLSEYLPKVKTEVVDGVLKIYTNENLIRPLVKVKVGIDSLKNIVANGASTIEFTNSFQVKRLDVKLQEASKMELNLHSAERVLVNLDGASKLDAEGIADTLLVVGVGASNLEADDLRTKVVKVSLSGASKADVYALSEFSGKAEGASQISCKGNPAIRYNESLSGSAIQFK